MDSLSRKPHPLFLNVSRLLVVTRPLLVLHDEMHFALPVADELGSCELLLALVELKEQERERNHQIQSNNSLGALSSDSDHCGNQTEREQLVREQVLRNLSVRCQIIDIQLKQLEVVRSFLKPKQRTLEIRDQLDQLNFAIYLAVCKKLYILENRSLIIGGAQDDYSRASVHEAINTTSHVDLLLEKHLQPKSYHAHRRNFKECHRTLHGREDSARKAQLADYYNAVDPENTNDLWCPVLRRYISSQFMSSSYIVPSSLGEHNARHLFGTPEDRHSGRGHGHLHNPSNGLLIFSNIQRAIDQAQIAIVPASPIDDAASTPDLVLILLDKTIANYDVSPSLPTFAELASRPLEFRHPTHRPGLGYLYHAFCTTLLTRQHFDHDSGLSEWLCLLHRRVWASPEKGWFRRSALAAVLARMGAREDVLAVLEAGDMPTGEVTRGGVAAAEWDERVALAARRTSMELRLRWEGMTGLANSDSEFDDSDSDDEEDGDGWVSSDGDGEEGGDGGD